MKRKIYKLAGLFTSLFSSTFAFGDEKNAACDLEVVKNALNTGGWLNVDAGRFYTDMLSKQENSGTAKRQHLDFLARMIDEKFCPVSELLPYSDKRPNSSDDYAEWNPILGSVLQVLGFDIMVASSTGFYANYVYKNPTSYNPVEAANVMAAALDNYTHKANCHTKYYLEEIDSCLVTALTDQGYAKHAKGSKINDYNIDHYVRHILSMPKGSEDRKNYMAEIAPELKKNNTYYAVLFFTFFLESKEPDYQLFWFDNLSALATYKSGSDS